MMKTGIIVAGAVLLFLGLSVPSVGAVSYEIAPGGTYSVSVTLKKPSYLRLTESGWEVRVYFFSGSTNYCTGSWTQFGGQWVYSGWWDHRHIGGDWTDTTETKSVNISVGVVSRPRPEEDREHGMGEIPLDTTVKFRVRFIIRDIKATFSGGTEAETGYVTFYVGGSPFQYSYQLDQYGQFHISSEGLDAKIDQDSAGRWRLIIDKDMSAYVSETAPSSDLLVVPDPLEINLKSTAPPEPTYEIPEMIQLTGGVLTILVSVGVVVYLGFRKKETEEDLVPEY